MRQENMFHYSKFSYSIFDITPITISIFDQLIITIFIRYYFWSYAIIRGIEKYYL